MKCFLAKWFVFIIAISSTSCNLSLEKESLKRNAKYIALANEFIDAFYSFDSDQLKTTMSSATSSLPSLLYYQGWAEGGNYEIINRAPCVAQNDSIVVCPVTVKDDLIGALEIGVNVTDTFHIKILNGQIRSVGTSSNDPPLYHEAKKWVNENRPELIAVPCTNIWNRGPTPGDCVRAMVKGYTEFLNNKKSNK